MLSSKLVDVTCSITNRLLDFEYLTHIILDWVFTFVRVNRIQSWLVDWRRFRMQNDTVNGLLHFDLAIDVGYILWFICHWLNLSIWHLKLLAFINCILKRRVSKFTSIEIVLMRLCIFRCFGILKRIFVGSTMFRVRLYFNNYFSHQNVLRLLLTLIFLRDLLYLAVR